MECCGGSCRPSFKSGPNCPVLHLTWRKTMQSFYSYLYLGQLNLSIHSSTIDNALKSIWEAALLKKLIPGTQLRKGIATSVHLITHKKIYRK
ncbi:hypothetical protein MHBO_002606 [Bonamia ostreae]|uniref:Uncharacterized protein n=1 Tax=Bonamia ostreae TaxID=126728 RepID=A0ABV2AMV7_9EUKA